MRRQFATLLALILSAPLVAYAAPITIVNGGPAASGIGQTHRLADELAVVSTATVTTSGLDLQYGGFLGVWAECAGTVDVDIVWQVSPTTESTDFVDDSTAFDDFDGTAAAVSGFASIPMRYGRFKIVGNAGNGADAECDLWAFSQGPFK